MSTLPPLGTSLEDREVVVLVLGVLVASFVLAHLKVIKTFPWWPLPVLSAGSLLAGWAASVGENFIAPDRVNALEHLLYACHSVFLCVWVVRLNKGPSR